MSAVDKIVFSSSGLDPFAAAEDKFEAKSAGFKVHIRNQQRNNRKSLTTIQGMADDLDLHKIVRYMRKQFSTNGTILKDDEMGEVIQLQGDRRKDAMDFLIKYKICDKNEIKVHGF